MPCTLRNQRAEVLSGALEQPARDPYDLVVGAERRGGSVRVGRLGVIDVVDAADSGNQSDPVRVRLVAEQPRADRSGWRSVCPRQGGRRQGIGPIVRSRWS